MPHILVVEDEEHLAIGIKYNLEAEGFTVTTVGNGQAALEAVAATERPVDLVVLDLMLPGEDGISIARRLRRDGDLPILMLTARGTETDRIVGLEIGADDYVTKPFSPRELLARIRAVLRRTGERVPEAPKAPVYRFAGWAVDVQRRELRRPDGALVPTTDAEFDLLAAFVERPQRVLSREQLLDLARGRQAQLFDRSIDVAVMRLRRKIEPDPARPEIIRTVRNGGYMFALDVETAS
jgi:two-component system OmpR family response regulator